jgi:hypothetical protein
MKLSLPNSSGDMRHPMNFTSETSLLTADQLPGGTHFRVEAGAVKRASHGGSFAPGLRTPFPPVMNQPAHPKNSRRSGTTSVFAALVAARADKPVRIAVPVITTRPLLRGPREYLKALRAAEMSAWESARPTFS